MKKSLWILIIVAVVIVAYYYVGQSPTQDSAIMASDTPVMSPDSQAKPVYKGGAPKAMATPVADTRTYSQLVTAYEGKRIQFDDGCQATPKDMAYKNGTVVMLDNRSRQARTITIGSTRYELAALGFKIVTISSATLPQTINISCNANTNVSRIFLQANISQ